VIWAGTVLDQERMLVIQPVQRQGNGTKDGVTVDVNEVEIRRLVRILSMLVDDMATQTKTKRDKLISGGVVGLQEANEFKEKQQPEDGLSDARSARYKYNLWLWVLEGLPQMGKQVCVALAHEDALGRQALTQRPLIADFNDNSLLFLEE